MSRTQDLKRATLSLDEEMLSFVEIDQMFYAAVLDAGFIDFIDLTGGTGFDKDADIIGIGLITPEDICVQRILVRVWEEYQPPAFSIWLGFQQIQRVNFMLNVS